LTKPKEGITIDEAIEIKERWKKANYPPPLADEINADNLSIEALKKIDYLHVTKVLGEDELLPGETKD